MEWDVNINVGDAVKFVNDENIYEVTGVITDSMSVFCYHIMNNVEFEKTFEDVEKLWKLEEK